MKNLILMGEYMYTLWGYVFRISNAVYISYIQLLLEKSSLTQIYSRMFSQMRLVFDAGALRTVSFCAHLQLLSFMFTAK